MNEALIVLPTLGQRASLALSLGSLAPLPPTVHVQVRLPAGVKNPLDKDQPGVTVTTADDGSQRAAILNSWEEGVAAGYSWFSWINDDDFALPSYRTLFDRTKDADRPQVIYGDWLHVSDSAAQIIRTPRRVRTWHLAYGACYVPGVLPLLSRASVQVILRDPPHSRDSFDYAFWLQLSTAGATFVHCGAAVAAWRDHPDSRTQAQAEVGANETADLTRMYRSKLVRTLGLEVAACALAKADAARRSRRR